MVSKSDVIENKKQSYINNKSRCISKLQETNHMANHVTIPRTH